MNTDQHSSASSGNSTDKLSPKAHLFCGWPLLLLFIGGAFGGGMGAVAYAVNVAIYKSKLPIVAKILLNLLVGFAAFGMWLGAVAGTQSATK